MGQFASIESPVPLPVTDHLPGFAVILTPGAVLLGSQLEWYRLFSISFTLAAGGILYLLARRLSLPPLLTAAAFLFNSLVARYATTVMSEPYFVFLTLTALWLQAIEKEKTWYATGLLLGMAAITRPQGVLLVMIVVGVWTFKRRLRMALIIGGMAALVVLPVIVRNMLVGGEASGYLTIFGRELANFSLPIYSSKLKGLLGMIFPFMTWALPAVPFGWLHRLLAWTAIIGSLWLIVRGYRNNKT
jgi:4-amino-4-deoxy-L-arabinose transferase-like glycosyltransferase